MLQAACGIESWLVVGICVLRVVVVATVRKLGFVSRAC